MRLTLRNILAYLNDILEPDDKAVMAKKISDNDFASKLVHRIHDSTQRIRLSAPKLTGRGMGLDPNTVAEYLDYTLAVEQEPDFEKVCLESDMHLAEVASCYRVLALVLLEAADVSPAMRRRMYQIGSGEQIGIDPAHGPAASAKVVPPPRTKNETAPTRPQIPDYLRETKTRSGLWRVAATLLIAAVVGGGAVLAIGPEKVANFFGWGPGNNVIANQDPNRPVPPGPVPGDDRGTPDGSGKTPADGANPAVATNPTGDKVPGDAASVPPGPTPDNKIPATPNNGNGTTPPPGEPGDAAKTPPKGSGTDDGGITPKSDKTPPIATPVHPAGTNEPPANPPVAPPKPAEPAASGHAGVYITEEDVLMRWNVKGYWERIATRGTVSFGETLLVFPTYRPTINLNFGVSLQLAGETVVRLLAPDENGIPGMEILSGRVILTAAGKPGTKVKLVFSPQQVGILTFGDGASEAVCEVHPYHMPGTDPEKNVSPRVADLFANSGQIRWSMAQGNEGDVITAPARISAIPSPVEGIDASRDIPKWIKAEQVTDIDRRASKIFLKKLDAENSQQRLREFAADKNIENRSLAIRCLAMLGEFDDLIASLKDEDHRAMWTGYLDALTAAAGRDPLLAQTIRVTIEKQRGERAAELYRLLWGCAKADLIEGGQAAKLIDLLNDDDLDIRVVSFLNLKAATGLSLLYRPEAPAAQRNRDSQIWRTRLKDGTLFSKSPKGG